MTDESLTSRPPPRSVIEQVLAAMLYTFGKRYTDMWGATESKALAGFWAQQMAGYSDAEIKRGVAALSDREWPPTLPEFKRMCRPPIDPQAAYFEAVEGVQARERGERGNWSHPAIYWAAVKVGAFDLKNCGYAQIAKRWETALQAILDAGSYEPIPDPALALPAPGKTALSREKAETLLADLGASGILTKRRNARAWIARVRERQKSGDPTLPAAAIRAADSAEGIAPTFTNDF